MNHYTEKEVYQGIRILFYLQVLNELSLQMELVKLKARRLCSLQTIHLTSHYTSNHLSTQVTCNKECLHEYMQILNLNSSFLKVRNHLASHYFFHQEIYSQVLNLYVRSFLLFLCGKLKEPEELS